jgi:acetate kinase
MNVLVVNAGSSSLKLRLLGPGDEVMGDELIEDWDPADVTDTEEAMRRIERIGEPRAIGHRVVHGGERFVAPTVLDESVEKEIRLLTPLAPLHQPAALAGIKAVASVFPGIASVACFDTAYHATIPSEAATYALPAEWRERWPLRRFGFHGLSHGYAARRSAELVGRAEPGFRVVTCHLGAGASLCASRDGRSVDTTMGFTPLEGLVMETRSGSVDPGLVLWLITHAGVPAGQVAEALERESGLTGLAGTGDMRALLHARAAGDDAATLALDVYGHRLAAQIAAMTASLGGIDALAFTGGVGEHAAAVRAEAAERLAYLGVVVDVAMNEAAVGVDADIGALDAAVRTVVVVAREDLEIARQTRSVVTEVA